MEKHDNNAPFSTTGAIARPSIRRRKSLLHPQEFKRALGDQLFIYVSNTYVKTFVILLFFIISILFYKFYENWSLLDCVFFVVFTVSTIGYGYIVPTTPNSKLFTMFLMCFGVCVIFSSLSDALNVGIGKLNRFLTGSGTAKLKRTELLFQRRLILSVLWVFLCALLGAVIVYSLEGLSFGTALYFIIETITVSFANYAELF
jgi:hypothetical protein